MNLSQDQAEVYTAVRAWLRDRGSLLTLGGYAGTGKTTVLSQLALDLQREGKRVAYVAFTGRAFSVLARKMREAGVVCTDKILRGEGDCGDRYFEDEDVEADREALEVGTAFTGTIHRLLYKPVVDRDTEELRGFSLRTELDREYDLLVCDEASMVSDDLLHSLRAFGVPLLAVGDHGQLPPVAASGELMRNPMLRLEKIHRQAEGSPIIQLASHVRQGGSLSTFRCDTDEVNYASRVLESGTLLGRALRGAGSLLDVGTLCWTNKTRVFLSGLARRLLERKGVPRAGELVLCLRNITDLGIFNGMRGVLETDGELGGGEEDRFGDPWILSARVAFPSEGVPGVNLDMCAPQFNRPDTFRTVEELKERGVVARKMSDAGDLFDFGYAMTVHKSQGSQWDDLYVYLNRPEKPNDEDWRRWMYTAVTRAARRITVLR